MHVNYRRNEDRKFCYLRDYLRVRVSCRGYRNKSLKEYRKRAWKKNRAQAKQALKQDKEMPVMRRSCLWDAY